MMRWRLKLPVALIFLLGATIFLFQQTNYQITEHLPQFLGGEETPAGPREKGPPQSTQDFAVSKLPPPQSRNLEIHPILQLTEDAKRNFNSRVQKQSTSLSQAVEEYKRRYGIQPPPNFDKWYDFAKSRSVVFIDEYDSIQQSLLPFWAIPPDVIRSRARESLGYDNFLIDVTVRNGRITTKTKGWQQRATADMMQNFVQWLPDMDLAFNTHDEPRVILSENDLNRLVEAARAKLDSLRMKDSFTQGAWSARPADMDYDRIPECPTTRFNRFPRQATWTHSRNSCPVGSAARSLDEDPVDNTSVSEYSELHLIRNKTSSSDICDMPSLRRTYGLFDRPNAFDIAQDLFPVFSQSKINTYQDILYPSPWYWAGKVKYSEVKDKPWDAKMPQLYWRGSTTGGYSRGGGWKRQHRQNLVHNINSKDVVRVLRKAEGALTWSLEEADREEYAQSFSVHFSMTSQCDPSDCKAQQRFFGLASYVGQADAWKYKYLLDIDGNAFSGRFYAFLHSFSTVFKASIFREWHDEDGWIQPWVHYVPMSLKGHEYAEVVRYLDKEEEGRLIAKQMADDSRAWAQKALRNDDLEVWFFRLLLEYGRIVDDNRDMLGFSQKP